jgi:enoyl-CoA hydratase/carnithine racemase
MTYKEILFDVRDQIATITLNRPEKLNAWTAIMESEYRHAMAEAESREDVRVIVVTGAGKGFCAGADMSMLSGIGQGNYEAPQGLAPEAAPGQHNGSNATRLDYTKKYSWPLAIEKPIIAAINGAAAGLGLVNALYCDLRFAADTAKFSTAFVRRGLIAEHGISWLLPRIVGIDNALDLLLSGRTFLANEAKAMGLVTRVVPAGELMDTVRAYAKELAVWSSPRSTAVMKRQIYATLFSDLATAIDVADAEMMKSLACDDFREGVASFIEKREPAFTGK